MNDGTTASGFTIVISATNDSDATFQSGTAGDYITSIAWSFSTSMYHSSPRHGRPVICATIRQ